MTEIWFTGSSDQIKKSDMMKEINEYILSGGKVFVGTDSQIKSSHCIFITAICLHSDRGRKYAKYFFKKHTKKMNSRELRDRIMREVQRSIDTSFEINKKHPSADIEVHVDVGLTNRSATRKFADAIFGWVESSGFECKMKPHSWASSSLADWHTK